MSVTEKKYFFVSSLCYIFDGWMLANAGEAIATLVPVAYCRQHFTSIVLAYQ